MRHQHAISDNKIFRLNYFHIREENLNHLFMIGTENKQKFSIASIKSGIFHYKSSWNY